jgi:toxin ParE1/3/4
LTHAVVWLDDAAKDLEVLLDHIENESPRAALAMALAIRQAADRLLTGYPKIGRKGRVTGTRELVIARTPFVVIYRVRSKARRIQILRVLHGAQQWPPRGTDV